MTGLLQKDTISNSPYKIDPYVTLNDKTTGFMSSYSINCNLSSKKKSDVYICNWKNKFITSNIIEPDSLTFQEDEALLHSLPNFPNPVKDWSYWGTLSFYYMKLYTYLSSASLNLRITEKPAKCVKEFFKAINHPGPSITTEQRNSPALSYENQAFRVNELYFHLKLLRIMKIVFPFKPLMLPGML